MIGSACHTFSSLVDRTHSRLHRVHRGTSIGNQLLDSSFGKIVSIELVHRRPLSYQHGSHRTLIGVS